MEDDSSVWYPPIQMANADGHRVAEVELEPWSIASTVPDNGWHMEEEKGD